MMPKPVSKQAEAGSYIGIDPGRSGGLAWLLDRRPIADFAIAVIEMPATDLDLLDWIKHFAKGSVAVLEKVWGHTGSPQPGSRMFNFGVNYGLLRMALTASGIPFEEVVPRTWQKALSIPPRKKTETKTQWKNRLRQKAQQLFPNIGVTLATADAILLAEFCRRKHEGKL